MSLMNRRLYKRIQTNQRNTRHVIPHSPSSCFVKHSQTENDGKVSIRFEKNRTWMQTKGEAAAIQSVLFLSSRLALSGKYRDAGRDSSFKWVVPDRFMLPIHVWTSTQWVLFPQSQCTRKPVHPLIPIQGGSVTGWVLENFPYKKGSFPPTTWWVMHQQKININMTTTDVCFSVDCSFRKQKRSRIVCC